MSQEQERVRTCFLNFQEKSSNPFQHTVQLGFKEWLNEEQLGNSEPFSVTNLPVHLINSEQIGNSEQQLCDEPKVHYCQVRLCVLNEG